MPFWENSKGPKSRVLQISQCSYQEESICCCEGALWLEYWILNMFCEYWIWFASLLLPFASFLNMSFVVLLEDVCVFALTFVYKIMINLFTCRQWCGYGMKWVLNKRCPFENIWSLLKYERFSIHNQTVFNVLFIFL